MIKFRTGQGRPAKTQDLQVIVENQIALNESLLQPFSSDEEKQRKWLSRQMKESANPDISVEEIAAALQILEMYVENSKIRDEFYAKFFLLSVSFRKFLAAHPPILIQLLHSRVDSVLLKCIGFFIGFRHLPEFAQGHVLLERFENMEDFQLNFATESLPKLPFPFATSPLSRPDLLLYHQNLRILDLNNRIEILEKKLKDENQRLISLESQFGKFQVTTFEKVEVGKEFSVIVKINRNHSWVSGELKVQFSKPQHFQLISSEYEQSSFSYRAVFQPLVWGRYAIESMTIGDEEVPQGAFSFDVIRDYLKIPQDAQPLHFTSKLFQKPWGLAIDDNILYVTDTEGQNVLAFDLQEDMKLLYSKEIPSIDGENPYPRGIAIHPEDHSVFVCLGEIGKIQIINNEDALCFGNGKGDKEGQFKIPRGLCIGPQGEMAVVDSGNFRIQIFSKSGHFIRAFGKQGRNLLGDFYYPASVAYQPREGEPNRLIVTDCDNHRVQILTWEGVPVKSFAQFYGRPSGIFVDPFGNLLVTDLQLNTVHVFDPEGELITEFGSTVLEGPRMIACDSAGRIFVAECDSGRISIF